MSVDVRTISKPEVRQWVDAVRTGFLNAPAPDGDEAEYRTGYIDLDHTWGAFDGDRIVGTLASFATRLAVPGRVDVAATALTHVTVAGTHRRRGLLTRMITADLASCAARGDAVSVLVAAEYPIYGRYGYGPAIDGVRLEIDAVGLAYTRDVGGSVELVDRDTLLAEAVKVHDAVRLGVPGAIERHPWWWDVTSGVVPIAGRTPPMFFALGRDRDGQVDGWVAYSIKERWLDVRPRCELEVHDLVGLDAEATVRLWRHCTQTDWVGTVVADDRGVDEPLRWYLSDPRAIAERDRCDRVWLRVLDTPAALAGRRYLAPGRVVLEVDDDGGYAAGRFVLEGGPDGASCAPTTDAADLRLDVRALGTVYLGNTSLATLAANGMVDERRSGAVATADAMFRSAVTPWCITHF